jgi:hypothetical protein
MADAFKVEDGAILTHGAFTHLFYSGPSTSRRSELRAPREFNGRPTSNSASSSTTENPGPKKRSKRGLRVQIAATPTRRDPEEDRLPLRIEDDSAVRAKDNEEHVHDPRSKANTSAAVTARRQSTTPSPPPPPTAKRAAKAANLSTGTPLQAHDP